MMIGRGSIGALVREVITFVGFAYFGGQRDFVRSLKRGFEVERIDK